MTAVIQEHFLIQIPDKVNDTELSINMEWKFGITHLIRDELCKIWD